MRMLEPGLHLSVGESHRLIAQARRLRSDYLRMAMRQLASWIARWSRSGIGGECVKGQSADNVVHWQATPPADTLKPAA